MSLEIHLVGKKWRNSEETIDGFKVLSVVLELAAWKNNELLYNYMSSVIFSDFPLPGSRLYEEDLDKIIEALSTQPSMIYGNDTKQAEEDLATFLKVKKWYLKYFPNAHVEYDVAYTGP